MRIYFIVVCLLNLILFLVFLVVFACKFVPDIINKQASTRCRERERCNRWNANRRNHSNRTYSCTRRYSLNDPANSNCHSVLSMCPGCERHFMIGQITGVKKYSNQSCAKYLSSMRIDWRTAYRIRSVLNGSVVPVLPDGRTRTY